MARKRMIFVQSYGVYVVGDLAVFEEEMAEKLMKMEVAIEADPLPEPKKAEKEEKAAPAARPSKKRASKRVAKAE